MTESQTFAILKLAMICSGMQPGQERVFIVRLNVGGHPYRLRVRKLVCGTFHGEFSEGFGLTHDDPTEYAMNVVVLYGLQSVELSPDD